MDKDSVWNLVKHVDTQLFEIVNNFICSICKELFNKPVTTPCGHSFCNGCIKRVISSKDNSGCPLCKNPVKRYGLQTDEVKSVLTKICQELPAAFEKDVKEVSDSITSLEELSKTSKLFQLYNQEFFREFKNNKQKSKTKRKSEIKKKVKEAVHSENDSGSFIPVLKRSKNVLEYVSAKKKRLDDLVSISQTEPASNSSFCNSSELNTELDKKLEKIEKISPDKKVHEWFSAVGDNIFINSPSLSTLESDNKNESETEKGERENPKMIKKDYNKPIICSVNEKNVSKLIDPYEFVPSQNNRVIQKKRQKKSKGQKIPDFKALLNFTKENIKRYNLLLQDSKAEPGGEEEVKDSPKEKQITASQKFDILLSETKPEPKKSHALYSASQTSSTQFLDVSFQSKIEANHSKKKNSKARKKLIDEDILFKDVEMLCEEKKISRTKRKRSSDNLRSEKRKKLFVGMEARNGETPLEKLTKDQKPEPPTKLGELLKELLNDDIIYSTIPANAPVRLPDLNIGSLDFNAENRAGAVAVTQNTDMIGFCTQEETQEEKNFKKMVENMEKELYSGEHEIEETTGKAKDFSPKKKPEESELEFVMSENENSSCDSTEGPPKNLEPFFIEFLHLGKLTPLRRRTKSTVVKLVFPIGLTSLARRRGLQNKLVPETQVTKKLKISTGIQTSQQIISSFIQTSQVPRTSVHMQTSQEVRPSVEIQTTQKRTTSAEIQTSPTFACQEIQTTQIGFESAQVQTLQMDKMETPIRKASNEHRKIIRKNETTSGSPVQLSFKELDEDIIMDFGVEKDLEDSWQNAQKHKHFVEVKNKKNKEQTEKLVNIRLNSEESDDSDIQTLKKRKIRRIFSQDPADILEDYETRQKIPLDIRKINKDEEMEVIDLTAAPENTNSEEQMNRVLRNIDLDLPKRKNPPKGEKSEESDSDFFVEQTPPRPTSRTIEDLKNFSRSRTQKQSERGEIESQKKDSEETDLIADSVPKGFSESFLLQSSPHRIPLSPEKIPREDTQKKGFKIESTTIELPDENDQNQLNAFESRAKLLDTKAVQLKAAVDAWKRTETSHPVKSSPQKRLCVVASSVKNSDLISKFVSRFKIDYLNKPTKDMTHLIVGLHENEDKEMLPLCTPKLLFAMANKKWVVSEEWVETCLQINVIVPEEPFETLDPGGGRGCLKARLSSEQLLKDCEIYLLGEFQMMSKEELAELIIDCGGTIMPSPEKFSFMPSKLRMIIADRDCLKLSEKQLLDLHHKHSTAILSRDVIIMSVQSFQLVNFFSYLLHPSSEEHLVKLGYPLALVKNEDDDDDDDDIRDNNRSTAR